MLESLILLASGGALTLAGSYFQHRWKSKREDELREADERARRVQVDRDAVAELLGAMLDLVSAVANLGAAYETAAATGARINAERAQYFQERVHSFGLALASARLSVRNPAARPSLEELHQHWAKMVNHLSLASFGQPSKQFTDDFAAFHKVTMRAWLQLEEACLTWDGSLTPVRAVESPPRKGDAPAE